MTVVEDEMAVREGQAVQQWLAQPSTDPATPAPRRLLLVDHQLHQGRTGSDALTY